MTNPRLASRYAKSLLDLSIEKNQVENVVADMKWLKSICKSNKDFVTLLRSPIIKPDTKNKIVDAITKGSINEITAGFTRLLINKGRESNLPEIVSSFVDQYNRYKEIHIVKLTTATPASEDLKNKIIEQITQNTDLKNIELEAVVNEDIIGGFVLQTGDKLIDASVSYDLKTIARQFENNDFIYKVR
jgi:F-type H+-transporting ATPase subunit delta